MNNTTNADLKLENIMLRKELEALRAAARSVTKSDSDDAGVLCSELRATATLLNAVQENLKELREKKLYELESENRSLKAERETDKKIIKKFASFDDCTFDQLFSMQEAIFSLEEEMKKIMAEKFPDIKPYGSAWLVHLSKIPMSSHKVMVATGNHKVNGFLSWVTLDPEEALLMCKCVKNAAKTAAKLNAKLESDMQQKGAE